MAPTDFSHQRCEFFQPAVRSRKKPSFAGSWMPKAAHAGELGPNVAANCPSLFTPSGIDLSLHDHLPVIPGRISSLLIALSASYRAERIRSLISESRPRNHPIRQNFCSAWQSASLSPLSFTNEIRPIFGIGCLWHLSASR